VKRTAARSAAIKAFALGNGPEPKVDVAEMTYRDLDGPEESAAMRLASAINYTEGNRVAVPWDAQVRASAFQNAHGLAATLTECRRLEALLAPTDTTDTDTDTDYCDDMGPAGSGGIGDNDCNL
jgi:hypothetical protein